MVSNGTYKNSKTKFEILIIEMFTRLLMFCLTIISRPNLQPAYELVFKLTPLDFNDFTHSRMVVVSIVEIPTVITCLFAMRRAY